MEEKIASFFKFKENHTNLKTETIAGLTTFVGMAYILAVNPDILSVTGMDKGAVYTATALAAFIGTLMMALMTNYPFALAPGMGVNAYFAYTVCLQMGYSWETALTAVLIEGIIFIILSVTNVRQALFNAIPANVRIAITAGIGLFIAMIGFINAGIVVNNDSTLVSMYKWAGQDSGTVGLTVMLALIGVLITAWMYAKGFKAGILVGIFITWVLGIICQLIGLYIPDPELGLYSLIPDFSHGIAVTGIGSTFCKFDFSNIWSFDFAVVVFAFLFVDLFDTIGTLMGCSLKAGYIKGDEPLPRVNNALLADALATTVGACLGTSTTTTYVESSLGVAEGGRTGFTGIVVAVLFLLSLVLSPIFLAIPSFATAPALIIVGFLMMQQVTQIDFDTPTEGIPAFLTIIAMPLMYSIAEGIGFGVISYVFLNLVTGKRDKISAVMYVIALLFICKYIFI